MKQRPVTNQKKKATCFPTRRVTISSGHRNLYWLCVFFVLAVIFTLKVSLPLASLAERKAITEQPAQTSLEQDDDSYASGDTEAATIIAPANFPYLPVFVGSLYLSSVPYISTIKYSTVPTPPPWFKS